MACRTWIWGIAVTAVLALAAPGKASAQDTTLAVTVDGLCICHAPMFVGEAKGIFRQHGVEVHLTFPAVVAQVRAAGTLLTGIFMAFGDATGTVPTDAYLAVVGRKASGLREGHLEDLKGKKVGVPRGTIAHQYLFYALTAKGLDPLQDVTIHPTPPGDMAKALESGAVDAITIWEPVASQGLRMADTVLVKRGGNHIQFLDLRVVAPPYLAAHPATVKRFIAAFAEAAQFVRQHPDETTDILMPQVKGLDRATVRTMLGYLHFDLRISKATVDAAQQGFTFAQKIGAMQQMPRFEDMVDLTLFKEVEQERPELFNDLPAVPTGLKL